MITTSLLCALALASAPADFDAFISDYSAALRSATWQDWYVDNSWTGETHGTQVAPFTDIQAAIDFVAASNGNFAADTLYVRDSGIPYHGPIVFPNMNALRLEGWGGRPTVTLTGAVAASTIMSGSNYFSAEYACMPPAQVGLKNLRIENFSTIPGHFCADIQTWVSWENADPARHRYGVSNVVFDGGGAQGGVRLRDLDQGHMVPWGIPYNNFHTSMVQACRFETCATGVEIMPMQCALLSGNWFVSNAVGVTAAQATNWPYLRPYNAIDVAYNVFAWCGGDGIAGGVYSNLVYRNNTLYMCGGTGVTYWAGVMGPYGEAALDNNLFYGNYAAWDVSVDLGPDVSPAWNAYFTNTIATGWESQGESNVFADPLLVTDVSDPWFLHPLDGSPIIGVSAAGGATYLGALPPVPEPGAVLAVCAGMLYLVRRRAW